MMTFQFLLNDVPIDEPIGFQDFAINIKRDTDTHGVMFESSAGELGFYGLASHILQELEEQDGLEAVAVLKIIVTCGVEVDLIEGNLLFPKFRKTCGTFCIVYMPLEQRDCTLTLRNRIDQEIDLDKPTAQDGITVLPHYDGLNIPLTVVAQAIKMIAWAETQETTVDNMFDFPTFDPGPFSLFVGYFIPGLEKMKGDSFGVFNYSEISTVTGAGFNNYPPFGEGDQTAPVTVGTATILGSIQCDLDSVVFSNRFVGNIKAQFGSGDPASIQMRLKLFRLPAGANPDGDGPDGNQWVEEYSELVFSHAGPSTSWDVDVDIANSVNLIDVVQGDFFQWGIFVRADFTYNLDQFIITTKPGTFFKMEATALCEDTTADVSLVNETGSRIVESITDGCVRMKSDYYGRVDSQPYYSAQDGCGSLRVLTSGLKLRRAENPVHFMSMAGFFQGLRAIDNVGWGIEPDTELGGDKQWVRIEPVEYFYNDEEIIQLPFIPEGQFETDPTFAYSQIDIGYEKWETERINGLNEFNSNKVFRTGLKSINNRLEAVSNFVAAGQAIESTRQQSFAETGAADTTYDNDTFIICVDRPGYAYAYYGNDYVVERGNIGNPSGIFSPDTAYNWRIRPRYNLMRWWKSIMQSYKNLTNTASRLFFGSGTGNLLASGYLNDDCRLDSVERREDEDLIKSDFLIEPDLIYQPNKLTFTYPLSLREFLLIKSNPYGFINAQCGTGEFVKGYILTINYNLNKGTAEISLLLKYENNV